jgi:hypothetical protein
MAEPLSASSPDAAALARGSIHIARWGRSGLRVALVHGGAQGSTVGERNFVAHAFRPDLAGAGGHLADVDFESS